MNEQRNVWIIILAVVFVYSGFIATLGSNMTGEGGFSGVGRNLIKLVAEGKFIDGYWRSVAGNYGAPNPRLAVYVLGFFSILTDVLFMQNVGVYTIPPDQSIRFLNSLFSVGSIVLFYWILMLLTNSIRFSFIGIILLFSSQVFRSMAWYIYTDNLLMLLSFAALYYALKIWTMKKQESPPPKYFVYLGLFSGLALSTKMYALGLLPMVMVVGIGQLIEYRRKVLSPVVLMFLLIPFVFLLSNPLLWWDQVYGLRMMTFGHIEIWDTNILQNNTSAVIPLYYTFNHFFPRMIPGEVKFLSATWWMWLVMALGVLLSVIGVVSAKIRGKAIVFLFFMGYFAVILRVSCAMRPSWFWIKTVMMPAAGAIMMSTLGILVIVRKLSKTFRRMSSP